MANKHNIPQFSSALLHPRYWVTWLLFGIWWLSAQLPYKWQLWFGRIIGFFSFHLATRRKTIAARNLELCFPELSEAERQQMLRENIDATAIAIFETGMAWFASRRRLYRLVTIDGIETLQAFAAKDQGVLLLVLHFTTLELLGAYTNWIIPKIDMTYRPHRNAVYDFVQARQRARHNPSSTVVARGDVRGMVRSLRSGRCISYLPDQDYGRKHSVFAPLFGIPAATVTALSRIAGLAKAPVVPLLCHRLEGGKGYRLQVLAPLRNFPTADMRQDAKTLNAHVETSIRKCPQQYLWVHRRFKTRPEGEPDLYRLPRKQSRKR